MTSQKIIVAVNLISFRDTKAVGTLVFTRRLFAELNKYPDIQKYKFVIYIQKHLNINDFNIMSNCDVEIVRVPMLSNAIKRIIFEQTMFYFYLSKCDVMFTPSLSLPFFGRHKKIVTIHDMVTFFVKDKYSRLSQLFINQLTKIYIRISDVIITVSENSKNDICKYSSISPSKVKVIYNFIGDSEIILKRDNFVSCPKVDIPYFITVSTLQPAKNIDRLILGFTRFSKAYPQYKLYIVGNKGWRYEKLFDIVKKNQMTDKIIFTGYLEDESLAYLYEKSEGVVYMSLFEGFGIPPLEGFYHNKICLASNTSSIPEVVGEAGILKDPLSVDEIADGFRELLLRKDDLSTNINRQIAKFNPAEQASKFINLINDIL